MPLLLWMCWGLYLLAFLVNHLRVRSRRNRGRPENRVRRARLSDLGMALQFIAIAVSFFARRPGEPVPALLWAAVATGALSVGLSWYALAHLGRQWRLQATVTDDHELITSGPYKHVRHPIYLAFLGMLVFNVLLLTAWPAAAVALALFATGTELRTHAEDRLLREQFPEQFPAYAASTAAWIPPIR